MNKPISKLLLGLIVCFSSVAAAQSATPAAGDNTGAQANATATSAAQQKAVPAPGDRNCIRDTGSLIKPKPGHCLPVAGRSYTREDLQNTGETKMGPALEKLDPAITIRGGH